MADYTRLCGTRSEDSFLAWPIQRDISHKCLKGFITKWTKTIFNKTGKRKEGKHCLSHHETSRHLLKLIVVRTAWVLRILHVNKGNDSYIFHVIFFYRDGYSRCGMYCAISICCDRLKDDREVDIMNAVRVVKKNRPQLVPTLVSKNCSIS